MSTAIQKKNIGEFTKRCRSMLWRNDDVDKKQYKKWESRIQELIKEAKYTVQQATVQAAKDHPCLKRLFREYDISAFDPNPRSHPMPLSDGGENTDIINEGKEQSHRENLHWAIATAGRYLRTNKEPLIVPNDSAYYMYQQACSDPKDFLGKYNQIEAKGDSEADEQRKSRSAGKRRIEEIDEMLSMLENPNQGEENEDMPT